MTIHQLIETKRFAEALRLAEHKYYTAGGAAENTAGGAAENTAGGAAENTAGDSALWLAQILLAKVYHLSGQPYPAMRLLSPLNLQSEGASEALALILEENGEKALARAQYKKTLEHFPNNLISLLHYGNMLLKEEPAEAEKLYAHAHAIAPDNAKILHQYAKSLSIQFQWSRAIALCDKALTIDPLLINVKLSRLGYAINMRDRDLAHRLWQQLQQQHPKELSTIQRSIYTINLTCLLQGEQAALAQAEACIPQQITTDNIDLVILVANLAMLCQRANLAEYCCRQILRVSPSNIKALYLLGCLALEQLELANGFAYYEYRRFTPKFANNTLIPILRLDCDSPLKSHEKVIVVPDQGFGDIITFMRFIPMLAARVEQVGIACHPAIYTITKRMTKKLPKIQVWNNTCMVNLAQWDRQILVCSLGHVLRLNSKQDIQCSKPYLPPSRRSLPKKLTWPKNDRLRAGLVWRGNSNHPNDHNRSLTLTQLQPLLTIRNIQWISLQYAPNASERAHWPKALYDTSDSIKNFDDLALLLQHVDFLVTVDSAPLHLAGAMGITTHALIPYAPDWRWGICDYYSQTRTYWYDSVQLWRQKNLQDWTSPMARLRRYLLTQAKQHRRVDQD